MHLIASLVLSLLLAAAPAFALNARCGGTDLIAALPADERAALRARAHATPHAQGNFWRATRDDAVIHLVGTYHFADPRHDAALDRLAPLIDRAAVLLVEAGPDEERQLAAALLERPDFMFITDGPTLPELLPEADWRALMAAVRARGIPPVLASRFRPWYIAVVLNMPPCAMADIARGGKNGLDARLIAAALARDLPVQALEPFDTLFSLFEGLEPADEIDLIRTSLLLEDRAEDMMRTLSNAYFAGESWKLWEFTLAEARRVAGDDSATAAQFDLLAQVLMVRRNRAWIAPLLAATEKGEVLAAFGALHLPGPEGVLALLAAEGFTLERF